MTDRAIGQRENCCLAHVGEVAVDEQLFVVAKSSRFLWSSCLKKFTLIRVSTFLLSSMVTFLRNVCARFREKEICRIATVTVRAAVVVMLPRYAKGSVRILFG